MRNHRSLRRALLAGALSVGVLHASAALALGKNDIINMQAAGLTADVIVSVIRSSTTPLTISPVEVDELRVAGVPAPVIDEICMRVGCAAATPAAPSGPVGPDLQREMELRQQQEAERMRLEQERMEQERQRMRDQIAAEQARQAQVSTAFQGLVQAERLERQGSMQAAAAVYRQFLDEVQPAPGSAEYAAGLSGFVRTMHAAGFRHVIRAEALQATLLGTSNPEFERMFRILVDVANDAQFMDPQFERLPDIQVGAMDQAFQDEWNYFLGRFFWVYGQFPRATEFLQRVSESASQAGQAQYLTGVIALEQREQRQANIAFQAAVLATERNESDPEVRELAYLALARVAYEIAQNDAALYYYRKIPAGSPRHARAVFESAWTYLMKQDWNRAVGTLHGLHSPYYSTWFFPELHVMEAFAYLQTCNLEQAELAIEAHQRDVQALQAPVQAFIANAASPEAYWEAISTYYERYGTAEPVALPIEAVRAVLSNVDFVNEQALIEQLEAERDRLSSSASTLGEFASAALASVESELRMKQIRAGLTISSMLNSFVDELTDWNVRAQEVGIEARTERITAVDAALAGMDVRGTGRTSVFVLAADWQYWPFEGEYWSDEVDNYRADLTMFRSDSTGRCVFVEPGTEP